jgi:hypothetical protein
MSINRIKPLQYSLIVLTSLLLGACGKQVSHQLVQQHYNYNEAISTATSREILLNIVREHYNEPPSFLAISSVTTGNSLTSPTLQVSQSGFSGTDLLGATSASLGLSGPYISPTITYTPNSGAEYANQLLTPISLLNTAQIAYSESDIRPIMRMVIGKLGPWNNYPPIPMEHHINQVIQGEQQFQKFCSLAQSIFADNGHRLHLRKTKSAEQSSNTPNKTKAADTASHYILVIPVSDTFTFTAEQTKLLRSLNINGRPKEITIVDHRLYQTPNTIEAIPRTTISTLKYLSTMIKGVPQPANIEKLQTLLSKDFFTIYTSKEEPNDAYLMVHKNNLWFYIKANDAKSKETFEALELLFNVTRITPESSTPMLVVN